MSSGRPLILVADDDADIRALVEKHLGHAGLRTVAAVDGNEALALARTHEPDLLLLDVDMPGLDGYTVCELVHADDPVPPPVIFLTGRVETAEQIRGFTAGAVDYVVKPFHKAELLARVRAALRTKQRIDRLRETAVIDRLTGVGTRAAFDERLERAFAAARRNDHPLSCVIVDIDFFKAINDRYGHLAGDAVLREVGARLRATVRESDEVFRYGGEEFVILLDATPVEGASIVAGKLLHVIGARPVRIPVTDGHSPIEVRASAGVAEVRSEQASCTSLLAAADDALYAAKRGGRDRLVLASTV